MGAPSCYKVTARIWSVTMPTNFITNTQGAGKWKEYKETMKRNFISIDNSFPLDSVFPPSIDHCILEPENTLRISAVHPLRLTNEEIDTQISQMTWPE